MTSIYWAGGEDSDLNQTGGGSVSTNTFYYRTAFARCALLVPTVNSAGWTNTLAFAQSQFWFSARHGGNYTAFTTGGNAGVYMLRFFDSSSIERIRISSANSSNVMQAFKVNSVGTTTQLGSNFSMSPSNLTGVPDKLDVFLNYNASGTLTIYWNGVQVFTFTGDTTTDSVTSLSYVRPGWASSGGSSGWSEMIVADTDTRSWNLQTLAPVANGNTHNFDTGTPAAANVNEVTLSDATLDGSTTAAQIDQYTIPALATGTFSIVAVGVSARMQKGASGPSKMDLNVRSTSDFFSADQILTTAWTSYQNWWMTDPNTSAAWLALPSNIGLKSVT